MWRSLFCPDPGHFEYPVHEVTALTVLLTVDTAMNTGGIMLLAILGLTANVKPLQLARFKAAGLSDLMIKPFEPEPLC